ncbi:ankyrin repeat-containing protein [Acrasis kona]|uniref:Ankyrin repeat-containing protein n=1 Tax=Acrasis kona TaxID=1008807 RepID=A0AAW2ZIN9_9EUKA
MFQFHNLFDSLPYGVKTQIPNASVPLNFERYGDAYPQYSEFMGVHEKLKDEYEQTCFSSDVSLEQNMCQPDMFKSNNLYKAHIMALKAYESARSKPEEAIKMARDSIEIAPTCDAYSVLAICGSTNYEEALEFYSKGIQIGPTMTKKFNEVVKKREVFGLHSTRGYFRCVHGEANTLRKMGRYKESIQAYERLIQLDPTRHTYSSYSNFRAHMPETYIKAGNWRAADKLLTTDNQLTDMMSSNVTCLWAQSLCDFVIRKKNKFAYEYFLHDDVDKNIIGALLNGPLVIPFMTGQIPLPSIPIPSTYVSDTKQRQPAVSHQANYASQNKTLWTSTPGALAWAQKNLNTLKCIRLLKPEAFAQWISYDNEPSSYETFEKYVNSEHGIFVNDVYTSKYASILHDIVQLNDVRYLKLLIDKGANLTPSKVDLYPIHLACYYDRKPEIIELLIKSGSDPTDGGKIGLSPLEMTANQGNWIAMHTVFKNRPQLKNNQKLLEALMDHIFSTSVYACIRGGGKCQRCTNDKVPHSQNLSFEMCVKLIFGYGYRHKNSSLLPHKGTSFDPLLKVYESFVKSPPVISEPVVNTFSSPVIGSGVVDRVRTAPVEKCFVCGVEESERVPLKRCVACKKAVYCGVECQKKDWKDHKLVCRK